MSMSWLRHGKALHALMELEERDLALVLLVQDVE